MSTRTITGPLRHPVTNAIMPSAYLTVAPVAVLANGDASYPRESYTVTTDTAGDFTLNLAVPDTGTAAYDVTLPSSPPVRLHIGAGAVTTLHALIALAAPAAPASDLALHASLTTTAHGGIVASSDSRLTNARTPTAHASTHASAGSDPISPAALGAATSSHTHAAMGLTIPIRVSYSTQTWTAMPAALTEFNGGQQGRIKVDLSLATQARLIVRTQSTVGASGAELRAQYSTDENTWAYLDGLTGPAIPLNAANATQVSAWVNLAAGAKADVFLRLIGINGDGSASPTFGNISVQVK